MRKQKPIIDTNEIKPSITLKKSPLAREELQNNHKAINKMPGSTYLSVITLNENG